MNAYILAQVSCWTHIYSNQKWDLQTILVARFHISWECTITKHESFASLTYMFHQSITHMADRITITYSKHACLIWSAGLQEDTFCQQNLDFCGGFNQMLVAAINVLCECSFYLGLYFASYINLQFIIKLNDGIIKCKTMMTNRQHVNKKRKRKLIFTLLLLFVDFTATLSLYKNIFFLHGSVWGWKISSVFLTHLDFICGSAPLEIFYLTGTSWEINKWAMYSPAFCRDLVAKLQLQHLRL